MQNFSIILKSQLEGATRMDAEFYNPDVFVDFSKGNWCRVAEVLDFVQYGTSEDLNEEKNGFPTLRLNEFDGVFIENPQKYCNKISQKTADTLLLKKNDILICRTNGNPKFVGKSAIVMQDNNYIFASYLFRVRAKKEIISPASLMTYLNSKIGRSEIDRFSLTSNQTNFSPASLREINIPEFSKKIQKEIDGLVDNAHDLHENSKSLYQQAEKLLLGELSLSDFDNIEKLSSIVNLSEIEIAGRMDAEYFQNKFEILLKRVENNSKVAKLNGIASIVRGSSISPDYYDQEGVPYLRGGDFSSGDIENGNLVYINKKFTHSNETIINAGDIIFASIGSVGTLAIARDDFEGSYISNNTAKIAIHNRSFILPEYLNVVLQSLIGKLQFEKWSTRTAQPKISETQVNNFLIPILPIETQKKISELVIAAHEARKKSKELLEEAKRKVEEMIEKGGGEK